MKSGLWFLIGLYLINTPVLWSQMEGGKSVSNTSINYETFTNLKDNIIAINDKDSTTKIDLNVDVLKNSPKSEKQTITNEN